MTAHRMILLIGSDRVFSASVATLLATAGDFIVTQVLTPEEGEAALTSGETDFEAVLMDLDSITEDGVALCARFRNTFGNLALILLSGSDDEMLLVRGLQAGADDFVRKPFRGTEILARLQTRLRGLSVGADSTVNIGRFVFHPSKRLLVDTARNTRVRLAEKEAKLLLHLYLGNGDVVSRVSLLHAVWGYNRTASSHTVETHVYRLRQKIEVDPARPSVVITERGGYRFASPKPGRPAPLSFPLRPHITGLSMSSPG